MRHIFRYSLLTAGLYGVGWVLGYAAPSPSVPLSLGVIYGLYAMAVWSITSRGGISKAAKSITRCLKS